MNEHDDRPTTDEAILLIRRAAKYLMAALTMKEGKQFVNLIEHSHKMQDEFFNACDDYRRE